jgi:hypothetical protein
MIEIIMVSMLCGHGDPNCLPYNTVERIEPIGRCEFVADSINSDIARSRVSARPVLFAWCARVGLDDLKR